MTSVADLPCMLPNTYSAISAKDSIVEGQSFMQLADQALMIRMIILLALPDTAN